MRHLKQSAVGGPSIWQHCSSEDVAACCMLTKLVAGCIPHNYPAEGPFRKHVINERTPQKKKIGRIARAQTNWISMGMHQVTVGERQLMSPSDNSDDAHEQYIIIAIARNKKTANTRRRGQDSHHAVRAALAIERLLSFASVLLTNSTSGTSDNCKKTTKSKANAQCQARVGWHARM